MSLLGEIYLFLEGLIDRWRPLLVVSPITFYLFNNHFILCGRIMSLTEFYKEPAALDTKKHRNLKFKPNDDFGFASGLNSVPLSGTEFFEASRHFPVLFVKNDKGDFMPLAMLSLKKEGHNLGDKWEGLYVPALLRRYPFAITKEGGVVFDQKAPQFSEEEGSELFNDEGEASDTMKRIAEFLRACEVNLEYTEQYTKALAEEELLVEFKPTIKAGGGSVTLTDFYAIDEKKFTALAEEKVTDWFKKGWIAWSYAHLHSIRAISLLINRPSYKPTNPAVK